MSENTMPAAEANVGADERELASYELAFHVLPTVAEGEVTSVVDALKGHITKANGEIFDEEAPRRFDLAYEIMKHLEGKNRTFKSAYFGWIRFKMETATVETVLDEIEDEKSILRHLLVRLTKAEEENPFRFHDAFETKMVEEVDVEAEAEKSDADEASSEEAETDSSNEETEAEDAKSENEDQDSVDDSELDEALKKDEA